MTSSRGRDEVVIDRVERVETDKGFICKRVWGDGHVCEV